MRPAGRRTPSIRKPGQKGHVMAEMALGFLPLIALMLGIIDFSFSIFMQSSFQNATREAVRFGITYNLIFNGTTYASQTAAMTAVAQSNAFGFLSSSWSLPGGGTGASTGQLIQMPERAPGDELVVEPIE